MFSKQDCGFTERVENQPGKKGAKVLGRVLGKLFSLKRTLVPSNWEFIFRLILVVAILNFFKLLIALNIAQWS